MVLEEKGRGLAALSLLSASVIAPTLCSNASVISPTLSLLSASVITYYSNSVILPKLY